MTRFGERTKGKNKTVNYEGEVAYKLDPALELYSAVCCASLQPKFYVPEVQDELERLRGLIAKNKPEFVAKLAVYAREKMYLRSIPLVLAVELAKIHKGDSLVSQMTSRVIQRADELTEILAYYEQANKREGVKTLNKLSKQLQKGIAEAFHKFDRYQLQKYNRETAITLKDALFLSHAKPKNEDEDKKFKQLIDDTLPIPRTWETILTKVGQEGRGKKEAWEEVIDMWVEVEG